MDVMKVSVLLLLAPQSQSSMCSNHCDQPLKPAEIRKSVSEVRTGLEVEFPLAQTLILEL